MPLAEALPAIHSPQDRGAIGAGAAAVRFSGTVRAAVGGRRSAMAAAGGLSRAAAGSDGQDRRPHRRLFPFELTAGQTAAIARNRRRHGPRHADEPAAARRRRQRQDDRRGVRDARLRRPRPSGGADGADGNPRPAARATRLASLLEASRVRSRCSPAADGAANGRRCSRRSRPAKSTSSSARTRSCKRTCEFAKLGLVVIDEQHKFGVRQRAALRQGEQSPHYLVMTATPIPRTVSMTLFGDLDVSTLRDMPPGRQPVQHVSRRSRPSRSGGGTSSARSCRRAAGVRRRAAGRRIGKHRRGQRGRDVRAADQRRAGGVSPRRDSRPDVAGRRRKQAMADVPRRPDAGAGVARPWSKSASMCRTRAS